LERTGERKVRGHPKQGPWEKDRKERRPWKKRPAFLQTIFGDERGNALQSAGSGKKKGAT